MKHRSMDRFLLGTSIGGFGLMSGSFLLMPFQAVRNIPGLLFWLGLAVGLIFQLLLGARRKAFLREMDNSQEKMKKSRIGILTFGSNREAIIADNAMVISLAATVLAFVLTKGYGAICYVCIAAAAFSFCMHCVLNGRNYFHLRNKIKFRQLSGQKKAKTKNKGEGDNE